jgi:hypothetical protein
MVEVTFEASRDEESDWLIAQGDAPDGSGSITTQGGALLNSPFEMVPRLTAKVLDDFFRESNLLLLRFSTPELHDNVRHCSLPTLKLITGLTCGIARQ